jgi:hypothetical protein
MIPSCDILSYAGIFLYAGLKAIFQFTQVNNNCVPIITTRLDALRPTQLKIAKDLCCGADTASCIKRITTYFLVPSRYDTSISNIAPYLL